jgi:hypothetical protein
VHGEEKEGYEGLSGNMCDNSGYEAFRAGTPTYIMSCVSTLTAGSVVVATCSKSSRGVSVLTIPTAAATATTSPEFRAYAPMIQLVWQSSDLQTSSSSTGTSPTSTGNATAPDTQTAPPASSGLSAGASAGIGVGATIAVLAVVALLLWRFCRRRKRVVATGRGDETEGMAQYSGEPQESRTIVAEAGSETAWKPPPVYEMDRSPAIYEMDTSPPVQEMGETPAHLRARELEGSPALNRR